MRQPDRLVRAVAPCQAARRRRRAAERNEAVARKEREHAMKLFGMGMPELVLILVVVLLIFGPKNLPKLGGMLGRGVKKLRGRVEDDEAPSAYQGA